MKICHECPVELDHIVSDYNDYDYFLVHHFEKSLQKDLTDDLLSKYEMYLGKIFATKKDTILDNSLYELGESFDSVKFAEWVIQTNPTYFISPDYVGDWKKNVSMYNEFENILNNHKDKSKLNSKRMVVIHGEDYESIVKCYQTFNKLISDDDIIAFSFIDYVIWDSEYTREIVIEKLFADGIINTNRKHHLLGATTCNDYKQLSKYDWIYSGDTSSPVCATFDGVEFTENGLVEKPKFKIDPIFFDSDVKIDEDLLVKNLNGFKNLITGSTRA